MSKDFFESLYEYLSSNSKLTNIVGKNIYPMYIPQYDKIPAVVYYPVSVSYDSALQKDTGFKRVIVQFDCHEKSFSKARKLSRLIKEMFQDYCGDMCGTIVQATFIKSDIIINDSNTNRFDNKDSIHVIEFEFFI